MKLINKFLLILSFTVVFAACDDLTELDYLDSPNALTPDQAGVEFVYNNIQLTFRNLYWNYHFLSTGLTRYTTFGNFTYAAGFGEASGDGAWINTYANLIPDIDLLVTLADERGLDIHSGSAKIMKAQALMSAVDYFGDIPFSEIGQGTDIISPSTDPGASVYAAADALLDEAIASLTGTSAPSPSNDSYYGGSADGWLALANTLKLVAIANQRLIGSGTSAAMESWAASQNIIDTEGEDFQFNYGNQRTNPNSRHPFYNNSWEVSDGTYQQNYFMWALESEHAEVDPRLRYYVYRQTDEFFNKSNNVYSCIGLEQITQENIDNTYPAHYEAVDPNLPYCSPGSDNGYYGRDHMNGSGIPPDGQFRTVYGLYPGGAKWDGEFFIEAQEAGTLGGLGAGIAPIMLSSFVHFLRAEAAAADGNSAVARAQMEAGLRASITKVLGFESVDQGSFDEEVTLTFQTGDSTNTRKAFYAPDMDDVEDYVTAILAEFDAPGADILDVVVKQAYLAFYGNSHMMYNMYRRTGRPLNFQPGIDAQSAPPGNEQFPRSLLYPAASVNQNANISQKAGLTGPVFWDNESATLR